MSALQCTNGTRLPETKLVTQGPTYQTTANAWIFSLQANGLKARGTQVMMPQPTLAERQWQHRMWLVSKDPVQKPGYRNQKHRLANPYVTY